MKSFTDYLNEKMDPRDHAVERDGKFVVVDKDGETVKTFEDKSAAEKYAVANHDKLMEGCGCDGTNEDFETKKAGKIGAAISNRKDLPASEKNVARRSLQRKVARAQRKTGEHNVNADAGKRYRVGTKRPVDPKDPKHAGLRRNATIAKTLKSYGTNEDVEQVDELKSSTLRSYADKANKQASNSMDTAMDGETPSERENATKLVNKRRRGARAATSRLDARKNNLEPKLKREDVEQVDEVSSKTLRSYVHKRSGQVRSDLSTGKHSPKTNKKAKGVSAALSRLDARKNKLEPELKREDVEQVDELSNKTMKSYIKKAQKDNTQRVTRMADKPDHMPVDKGEMKKLRKRQRGIVKAKTDVDMRKIAGDDYRSRMGEEVESVEEAKKKIKVKLDPKKKIGYEVKSVGPGGKTTVTKRKDMPGQEDVGEASGAWQRKEGKNKEGGLNAAGRASYERENPGSDLKAPVSAEQAKKSKGGKAAKRRKSFCARMGGMPGAMKDEKGRPTRKALALRKWDC
jgi:hypothetical protein